MYFLSNEFFNKGFTKPTEKWLITTVIISLIATILYTLITEMAFLNRIPFAMYIVGGISLVVSTYISFLTDLW